jgi:urea transporter
MARVKSGGISFLIDSTLHSYSAIFFSQKRDFGLLLLAATFVEPQKGAMGLLGLLCSNGLARLLGFDRSAIRKGLFGFNTLLLGLALATFYAVTWNLIVLVLLLSFLATLVVAGLRSLFWYYLRLPSLSVPFVLLFGVGISASLAAGKLELPASAAAFLHLSTGSPALDLLLKSLGSTFFQANVICGGIVLIALLLHSRLAFILGAAGLAAGFAVHGLLGADPRMLAEQYLGFNYVLTAVALGGIFLIPSFGSFLLAILATAAAAVFTLSAKALLPAYLPPTAIPFNALTLLVLYALRTRLLPSGDLQLSTHDVSSPEENLSLHRAGLKAARRGGPELALPFHGAWRVIQGFDGPWTHKDDWRFGIDFMVPDAEGRLHKGAGTRAEDFFGYDVPVLAPADGKVVLVANDVADNAVGRINAREPWGNAVIIEHGDGLHTCLGHLREGSVKVEAGAAVKRGQVVGRCGNSGRSPFPHLHMQVQEVPVLGAPALPFELAAYVRIRGEERTFVPRGVPAENDLVSNPAITPACVDFVPATLTRESLYRVSGMGGTKAGMGAEEKWSPEVDLHGNMFLRSSPAETRVFWKLSNGVFSVSRIEGSRDSALYRAARLVPDIPLVSDGTLRWTSEEESDYGLSRGAAFVLDLLSILGVKFRFELDNTLTSTQNAIRLVSRAKLRVRTPLGAFTPGGTGTAGKESRFDFARGSGWSGYEGDGIEVRLSEVVVRETRGDGRWS